MTFEQYRNMTLYRAAGNLADHEIGMAEICEWLYDQKMDELADKVYKAENILEEVITVLDRKARQAGDAERKAELV